jgi:Tol biopolymer transport system component
MRTTILAGLGLAGAAVALTIQAATPERIIFARVFPQPGQIGLFIANVDGSNERPLLGNREMDYDAVWSPDAASIVFTSERNGSADLYRAKPDGTGVERLTDSPAYDDQAAFSPDGTQLAFISTRAGGVANVWTLNLATNATHAVTTGAGGDYRPAWSPDGQWIAFSSGRNSDLPFGHGRWEHLQLADLYIVHPDGSGLKRLSEHGNFCGSPKWTADSRRVIAYCMTAEQTLDNRRPAPEHPEDTRIVSFDIDTASMSIVKSGPGVKFNPSLLKDGTVAYIRKDGDTGIYYSNGSRGPKGDIRFASFSPDGARVIFHKRVKFDFPVWTKAFTPNPNYEVILSGIQASYNPAGDRFVFAGRPPAGTALGSSIQVAKTGTNESAIIYQDPKTNIMAPSWSPSGDRILFGIGTYAAFYDGFHSRFFNAGDRVEGGAQIAMVRPDGSGYTQVTSGVANNGFPSMAPDGKRFVYRTFGPDGEGLRVMNLETKAVTRLTEGYDNFPLWSPRGDLIMFSRQADGDYEIYTVKPDGTSVKRLTYSKGNDAHMGWSPDGEHIVFASTRLGFKDEAVYTDAPQPYGELFVMKYDGSHVEQVTDNQWEDGTPAWVPSAKTKPTSQR